LKHQLKHQLKYRLEYQYKDILKIDLNSKLKHVFMNKIY
jgi:hypothetical protein